jgi:Raf kinase inhibitor-like YbhB/YbcL family protein
VKANEWSPPNPHDFLFRCAFAWPGRRERAPKRAQGYGRGVRRVAIGWVVTGLVGVMLAACNGSDSSDTQSKTSTTSTAPIAQPATMQLTSSAFTDNGTIPVRSTCAGEGAVPDLFWSEPPPGTEQLALLVFDPDAGTTGFVHYLVWGIAPDVRSAAGGRYPGGVPGMNGRGSEGWVAPCPPPGGPHHYQFTVFALDREPQIAPTANVRQFLDGIRGSVIAEGHLTGLFGR